MKTKISLLLVISITISLINTLNCPKFTRGTEKSKSCAHSIHDNNEQHLKVVLEPVCEDPTLCFVHDGEYGNIFFGIHNHIFQTSNKNIKLSWGSTNSLSKPSFPGEKSLNDRDCQYGSICREDKRCFGQGINEECYYDGQCTAGNYCQSN